MRHDLKPYTVAATLGDGRQISTVAFGERCWNDRARSSIGRGARVLWRRSQPDDRSCSPAPALPAPKLAPGPRSRPKDDLAPFR